MKWKVTFVSKFPSGVFYPTCIRRAETQEIAISEAERFLSEGGHTDLKLLSVEKVYPYHLEEDPGPDDSKDLGTYAGRGNEVKN